MSGAADLMHMRRSEIGAQESLEGSGDSDSSLYDDDADEDILLEAAAPPQNVLECQ